jgi:23S rRNA pseudouridine2605 synthase
LGIQPRDHRVSLRRALSKLGYCSRTQAEALIKEGRVRVGGAVRRDGGTRVDPEDDRIEIDGRLISPEAKVYLMLNKPRGLVTTRSDEKGRKTVYDCVGNDKVPWVAPVGRLDQTSEGLLLFSNDTQWAAGVLAPERHIDKTYHVQVDCRGEDALIDRIREGVRCEDGDFLRVKSVSLLRKGSRNSWLEVVLDEGKNRHIRRLLSALGINVRRLVRVAMGSLELGSLPKGACRHLSAEEVKSLSRMVMKTGDRGFREGLHRLRVK